MVLISSSDLVSSPKLLPPMSVFTSGVLYLLPLRGLQDPHVDVTLAPFNNCLSAGAWTMWFCMHALRGESCFLQPSSCPAHKLCCHQTSHSGGSFSHAWLLDGEPSVELGPLTLLGEPLLLWLSSCLWAAHPEVGVLTLLCFCSPTHLQWFLLYIFGCGKSFLLVFRSFLLVVAL